MNHTYTKLDPLLHPADLEIIQYKCNFYIFSYQTAARRYFSSLLMCSIMLNLNLNLWYMFFFYKCMFRVSSIAIKIFVWSDVSALFFRQWGQIITAVKHHPNFIWNTYFNEFTNELLLKLDMSMARRRLKSPRSLSGTSAHPTMVTLVNIRVMNGWLTSFSFHVNRPPHSWDKAISDSDLETPRSRSWVWSKSKVIQSAQYHINSFPFHLTSIRPTIPEIQLFWNLTFKHSSSRSWVRSRVKVTNYIQYPTDAIPIHFTSIGPTIPEIWLK